MAWISVGNAIEVTDISRGYSAPCWVSLTSTSTILRSTTAGYLLRVFGSDVGNIASETTDGASFLPMAVTPPTSPWVTKCDAYVGGMAGAGNGNYRKYVESLPWTTIGGFTGTIALDKSTSQFYKTNIPKGLKGHVITWYRLPSPVARACRMRYLLLPVLFLLGCPGDKVAGHDSGVDTDCAGDDDYDADGDGHTSDGYGGDDCQEDRPERRRLLIPSHPFSCPPQERPEVVAAFGCVAGQIHHGDTEGTEGARADCRARASDPSALGVGLGCCRQRPNVLPGADGSFALPTRTARAHLRALRVSVVNRPDEARFSMTTGLYS